VANDTQTPQAKEERGRRHLVVAQRAQRGLKDLGDGLHVAHVAACKQGGLRMGAGRNLSADFFRPIFFSSEYSGTNEKQKHNQKTKGGEGSWLGRGDLGGSQRGTVFERMRYERKDGGGC
jgi:hypothetical protein